MTNRLRFLPLAVLLCEACSAPSMPVSVSFVAAYDGLPLSCADSPEGVAMSDLRFYVHDIELRSDEGEWLAMTLAEDGVWQQADIGMVDLEDGSEGCLNGTAAINAALSGTVRAGHYRGLRFTLGVPFDKNHADPLAASGPLDDPAMHWHWRSGYKFLRAGVASADDGFWIHLGSTGCRGTVNAITACSRPNRVFVEIEGFAPGASQVVVDLAGLVSDTDIADSQPTDCSSAPSEPACREPFARLGLDFDTGSRVPGQSVFRLGSL